MAKQRNKPHDIFIKALLSDLGRAKGFLAYLLPNSVVKQLDFSSIEPEDRIQIVASFSEQYIDALFRIRLRRKNEVVHLLLEHKSYPDKRVASQLFHYIHTAYLSQIDAGIPLQPVFALLFYHGKKKWKFHPPTESISVKSKHLKQALPRFYIWYSDLSVVPIKDILHLPTGWLRAALMVLRFSHYPKELIKRFEQIFKNIAALEEGNFFQVLGIYYLQITPLSRQEFMRMVEGLLDRTKKEFMTIYDAILEEGIQQGLEQGLEQAHKETILKGIQNNIPVSMLCTLTGYSEAMVTAIIQQATTDQPNKP